MAFVAVPKDLNKVKSKVLFNLTQRQLICFGGGSSSPESSMLSLSCVPLIPRASDSFSRSASFLAAIFGGSPSGRMLETQFLSDSTVLQRGL